LISLDSLRADHLAFYGYNRETAPTLSSLISRDDVILFKNAYTTTAWTHPAHASVFTGLYPSEHGVFDVNFEIDPQITLPAKLSTAGYDTIAFLNNGWLTRSNITDGFNERVDIFEMDTPSNVITRNLNRLEMLLSLTDSGAKQTIANFERRHSTLSQPFFAFFHFMEPHYLYDPVRPHHRSYTTQSTIHLLLKQREVYTQRGKFYDGQVSINDSHMEGFVDLYDGEIEYIDSQLEKLFSLLKAESMFDDTMIIVFGDHGELFGRNGLIGHHFSLANELLHVPLLVKWPEEYRPIAESQVESYVEISDLFGTILATAGLGNECPDARTLETKASTDTHTIYAEYRTPQSLINKFEDQTSDGSFPSHLNTDIKAFRRENYKLVIESGEKKLYDVKSDPDETNDISDERSDLVSDLYEKLNKREGENYQSSDGSAVNFSDAVKEQLQNLGYI
jgi:arylsulfatase A-like enzyme